MFARSDSSADRSTVSRWLYRDQYTVVAWLLFLVTLIFEWRFYVRKHEAIYLLGSRRLVDPEFLANDLTWSSLPPTTFVYDHLLAPLWSLFGDFGVVVSGRLLMWSLFAWALALLARALRIPAWSVVAGFTIWMTWGQTLALCGSPLEGLQPKLPAYALTFLSLAFAMRGQVMQAGVVAGVATVFHVIIGGWGWLALAASLLVNRNQFTFRQLGSYLFCSLLFIVPLVLLVLFFHLGDITSGEQTLMDRIYVTFAAPHCCDPEYFMTTEVWKRAAAIFLFSPIVIFLWPHKREARILLVFTLALILFFLLGIVASEIRLYSFLTLFPFQLAKGLPALFLFVLGISLLGRYWPRPVVARIMLMISLSASGWLLYERDVFPDRVVKVQKKLMREMGRGNPGEVRYGSRISSSRLEMYDWIRDNTSKSSIFITPYLSEFWTYAERAQVASFRHPPLDKRLIEWRNRMDALNGSKPFKGRGFQIRPEVTSNESWLSKNDLAKMRDQYGATYYVTKRLRSALPESSLRFTNRKYYIYDVMAY